VDETASPGTYNFTLTFAFETLKDPQGLEDFAQNIGHPLESQLGLTLKPKKVPVDMLVR
jgi:uncharacterized protein (TIGR03435 family)